MRTLIAIGLFAGAVLSPEASADTVRSKYRRIDKQPQQHATQPRSDQRQRVECERARQEDPTGEFAGFPCWAREAFGRANRAWD
jgi:hypothetical protein